MSEHTAGFELPFRPEIPETDQHKYPGGSFEVFSGIVLAAAAAAYERAGAEKGIDPAIVHTTTACGTVSRALHDELAQQNIHTGFRGYPFMRYFAHYHLDTGSATPEPIVIDGAYQQFLDEPNPDAPRVLIVPRLQIREALDAYGVSERHHRLWLEARDVDRPGFEQVRGA